MICSDSLYSCGAGVALSTHIALSGDLIELGSEAEANTPCGAITQCTLMLRRPLCGRDRSLASLVRMTALTQHYLCRGSANNFVVFFWRVCMNELTLAEKRRGSCWHCCKPVRLSQLNLTLLSRTLCMVKVNHCPLLSVGYTKSCGADNHLPFCSDIFKNALNILDVVVIV